MIISTEMYWLPEIGNVIMGSIDTLNVHINDNTNHSHVVCNTIKIKEKKKKNNKN